MNCDKMTELLNNINTHIHSCMRYQAELSGWRLLHVDGDELSNPFLHRPFPFLPDWFHGLSDRLMILLCSTAGFVCMVWLSRLLVGFRTHFTSLHFHSFHFYARPDRMSDRISALAAFCYQRMSTICRGHFM